MVSRIVSELLMIALVAGVLGAVLTSIWIQYNGLEKSLDRTNIVTLSYVTCNSSILVYNYGYEDIEIREVYINSTRIPSFTILVYDPASKTWSPSTSIPARRLALIKVPSTLTSSTSITLITDKGVWSHTT